MSFSTGIIFDMDGTIWDSSENVAVSWNEVIEKDGRLALKLTDKDIKSVMGKTMDNIADVLFYELSLEERRKLVYECGLYENDYLAVHGGVLYDDVEATLNTLKEKYRLFIVSNCQSGYIEAFLDHYKMGYLFEDIECFGNNNLSKGENIRLVADRNNIGHYVYVGDIQSDYDSAHLAGAAFVHAAYGFGTVDADVIHIDSFTKLLDIDFDNYGN